jgi:hypothetical protein
MKISELVKELVRREGKKKQVDRAQMSEIVGHLSDMMFEESYESHPICFCLWNNGARRAKRKGKKK